MKICVRCKTRPAQEDWMECERCENLIFDYMYAHGERILPIKGDEPFLPGKDRYSVNIN